MSQKQYWKGLGELENPAGHQESVADEFKEPLPLDISDSMLDATTPRRDFLKYLGFSTAAAMLAASCEMPVRKAIPYAIKPEDIVPGIPNYYASTFVDGGDYCAIIIKTRDGRPIKIEGNPKSSITKGGTSARVQASVLNLYDKTRLRHPVTISGVENGTVKHTEVTFDALDRLVGDAMKAQSGKAVVLLTGSISSPTTKEAISQFLAAHPGSRHVVYDPISYSAMLLANEASYGKRALPSYHFEKANTIVSLDADFLGTWLSPVEFGMQYGAGRKVNKANMKMSRHYHVEGHHSITGANADMRATCKPSEVGAVAAALYNAVATGAAPSLSSPKLNDLVKKAAADLKAGNGIVVCGQNDVNIQTVVNAINDKIGANGNTINWGVNSNYWQGIDGDFMTLVNDMSAGNVGTLLIHGVNPSYTFDGKKFNAALAKVPVTVSFNDRFDETTQLCKYAAPDHHFLESWGDAEPKTGYYSLMQPGIAPIFKTRAFQESLLKWSGNNTTYEAFWKNYWMTKLGSQDMFDHALQDGVIEPAAETWAGGAFVGNVGNAISAVANIKTSGKELVIYQKVSMGHGGAWSNNPWLQEMPDPITKATWDNYICVSPATAKALHNELSGISEATESKKRVVKVTVNGKDAISLPIVAVPGMHNDVIAIAVGYGRDMNIGRAAAKAGVNVYPLVGWNNNSFQYNSPVTIAETAEFYDVAITQTHHSYEGREAIVREYTLEEFKKNPNQLIESRYEEIGHFTHNPWEHEHGEPNADQKSDAMEEGFNDKGTLYGKYDHPGIHWGMSIDLTSCIGCGACVIACQAENNVSVVGKDHVLKAHEMHWLHIDRYFAGDPNNPDSIQTIFQPMLCQHCDNAPCENVCPVSATNHSSEGINQMAYNRCIGTKYCANNCPYKVRHFNWMDWNKADCFDDNAYEDGRRDDMNDDLTRMVLNPDVTVRSRGVMEKCTFCVQRLQDAKLVAKKEGRPVRDGEAVTACQQACASGCIKFGNMNDKESEIHKLRRDTEKERVFYMLEQIHTLPNINYLSKIRNTDEMSSARGEEIEHKKGDVMQEESI